MIRNQKIKKRPRTVVFTYGRMNPPTLAHEMLIHQMIEKSETLGCDHEVVLSHSHDSERNPLEIRDKIEYMRRSFPHVNFQKSSKEIPTPLDWAAHLHSRGYRELIMMVGGDRRSVFASLIEQYNGDLYNFDSVEVCSIGERNDTTTTIGGVSSSMLRDFVDRGEFLQFCCNCPSSMPIADKKNIYNKISVIRGIHNG